MIIQLPEEILEVRIELSDDDSFVEIMDCKGDMVKVKFACDEGILVSESDNRVVR